jgi:hypothetical protein
MRRWRLFIIRSASHAANLSAAQPMKPREPDKDHAAPRRLKKRPGVPGYSAEHVPRCASGAEEFVTSQATVAVIRSWRWGEIHWAGGPDEPDNPP